MTVTTEIGKPRARKEDARLVTGQTNWTDNIQLPGLVHVAYLRSPMAHARITSVDVSAARGTSGVIAAFSGADFAAEQGSLPCAWPVTPDIVIPAHPPMATDEVRYVGEIVACVVARDRYAAADALELIDVEYEPLPAVLDMEAALAEGSPKVHEAGNKSFVWPFAQGDLDAAFRDAPVVVERTYRQQRLIPCGDGTPRHGRRDGGRRDHALVRDPDPARAPVPDRRGARHPRAEHPRHRAGRGRRVRVQAPGHGRGVPGRAARPQARPAGQVDRVAQRGQPGRAPRPRPAPADQGGGGRATAGFAACPWTCWPTWAPT